MRPGAPSPSSETEDLATAGGDDERLREEIVRLAPWHLDVQVTPTLSTSAFLDAKPATPDPAEVVTFISPRGVWRRTVEAIYPDGLEGRSFLDCACNCGGYSFWSKELGAERCFGFDVREPWIQQARFLLRNRTWPSDGIEFDVLDLYELPKRDLGRFELTLFKGIFYHLPDPIAGLKLAADQTSEVLIVDTAMRLGLPDGMLVMEQETIEHPMSGVYGLNWQPTGPRMMARILGWLGFPETKLTAWAVDRNDASRGRMQIVGSRERGRLAGLREVSEPAGRPG